MPKRRLVTVSLLLAGFTISACTAILVPDRGADGVQRCNTGEDCDATGDERYVAQCVFGADQPENSDKVCVAGFREDVSCNPTGYPADSRFVDVYNDATSNQGKAAYVNCTMENQGKRGCRPNAGACESGLEENAEGFCDDPGAALPAVNPSQVEDLDLVAGQDVLDQFCRSFFCDENFVCDTSKFTCTPCTEVDPFGEGGCGQIYLQGALSTVYTTIDEGASSCGDDQPDDIAKDDAAFGDPNEAPMP